MSSCGSNHKKLCKRRTAISCERNVNEERGAGMHTVSIKEMICRNDVVLARPRLHKQKVKFQ